MDSHGMAKLGSPYYPFYRRWIEMRRRCLQPKAKDYRNYGGRGITICDRWSRFLNFFEDMYKSWNPELTLDRKNNNKGYSPENCRWATRSQQGRNTRNNRLFTFNGKTRTVAEWAEESGIDQKIIHTRLWFGWNPKRAVFTPTDAFHRNWTLDGKTMHAAAWAKKLGTSYQTISRRLELGWSVRDALTKPVKIINRRK